MKIEKELLKKALEKEPLIVFIGQSGSGKGTLCKVFVDHYMECFPGKPYLHTDTGQLFRNQIPRATKWNRRRLKEIQEAGKMQEWPLALALLIYNFLMEYKGGPVFMDGSPRSVMEVKGVVNFFRKHAKREIIAFVLEIDDATAEQRMINRDDQLRKEGKPVRPETATAKARKKKLRFFHTKVMPAMRALGKVRNVTIHHIDSNRPKDIVAEEVLSLFAIHHSG